jgi:Protein of unknown function (DUF3237)
MAMTDAPSSARRNALLTGFAVAATAVASTAATHAGAAETDVKASAAKTATTDQFPMLLPKTEFVYEAIVDIAPPMQLGMSPFGDRRMVPITGGTFEGPGLRGKVLSGGADRQLVRRDGSVNLDAIYELQTDDGAVISVRNRVLSRQPKDQPAYRFSTLDITVADGKYGWLNDFVYVGTLNSLRPKRDAVVIRVYKVV